MVTRKPVKKGAVKKPTRKSQVTKKAPPKHLVSRRKKNTKPGYFPNPREIVAAYAPKKQAKPAMPFCVQKQSTPGVWASVAEFKTLECAKQYAQALADTTTTQIRVIKY